MRQTIPFIDGGFDTMPGQMSTILYRLQANPDQRSILEHEIEEVLDNKLENIDYDKLSNMIRLKYFIQECQRIDGIATLNFNQQVY